MSTLIAVTLSDEATPEGVAGSPKILLEQSSSSLLLQLSLMESIQCYQIY